MEDRRSIRMKMREKCDEMLPKQRNHASSQAAQHIIFSDIFKNSHRIGCYLARGSELSAAPIISRIWQAEKECYVPVLDPRLAGVMHFSQYYPNDRLVMNRFNIPEPSYHKNRFIEAEKLDLVLLPLTAFDMQGHRVGSGGGYYDRYFAFLRENPDIQKPYLCGFGYSFQETPVFIPFNWDVPLRGIVTELGFFDFTKRGLL